MSKTHTMSLKNQKAPNPGKNIQAIRVLKGIKQESLAQDLNISQTELSQLENSAEVPEVILLQCALIFGVSIDIIKNFDETSVFYSINNHVENNTFTEFAQAINQNFSPADRITDLYERLLKSEKEKTAILKEQLSKQ